MLNQKEPTCQLWVYGRCGPYNQREKAIVNDKGIDNMVGTMVRVGMT